jgi:hypothetical protein
MSYFVDLSSTNNNGGIAQALSTIIIRPLLTATSRTNWSISYFPGPPILTSSSTTTLSNDKYYPFWLLILIAIFGSITSVLTVLGNILVILAFFLDRQIRQPTNYFILSLSVSDFLIGLLSMPLLTIYIYAKEWPLNATICDIWLSLDYTVCLTSIYTVLFITIDRFCSVKMPAKYRKWRTKRKINIMIAITWAGKAASGWQKKSDCGFSPSSSFSNVFYINNALSTFKRNFKFTKWCLYVLKVVSDISIKFMIFF